MNSTAALASWQHWMFVSLLVLGGLALAYRLGSTTLARRQKKRRIFDARVRSGHLPLDLPSTMADLGPNSTTWAEFGKDADEVRVVDEHPTLQITYNDAYGKPVQRTIQVELLDLHRQAIVAKGNSVYDPRIFPLERITEARNASTGKPFKLGLWVDAVRVARRRREAQSDMQILQTRY